MSCSGVSRTASQSSITSTASTASSKTPVKSKRTRRRFTQAQLILLEQGFHRTSHPTREEREEIAQRASMDLKSVTIWFQNKRQIERKVALNNSTNHTFASATPPSSVLYSSLHDYPEEYPGDSHRRASYPSRLLGPTASLPNILRARSTGAFLSLDRIASRAEQPARSPRTPTKLTRHASHIDVDAVWETMPSSPVQPIGSPCSPFSRDILDFASKHPFGTAKRSLEWACAAARLAEKTEQQDNVMTDHRLPPSFDAESMTTISDDKTECYDTEVESISDNHEAITPEASQNDIEWDQTSPSSLSLEPCISETTASKPVDSSKDADDIMTAAYALCGLRRG